MRREIQTALASGQQTALIILRTLIGWHFLYEGYYKILLPGWGADGVPLKPWTSAGYLQAASGPLARLFQWMIDKGWIGWMDATVKISLVLIGLSLILGLFTRAGCWGALFFLSLFYLLAVPTIGTPQAGVEGTYLFVNKTLIEAAAVGVLLLFNTGSLAGLDLLLANWKKLPGRVSAEERFNSQSEENPAEIPPVEVSTATSIESRKD
jgi:thiosulfate dehydrogenase [quinone] large subunit